MEPPKHGTHSRIFLALIFPFVLFLALTAKPSLRSLLLEDFNKEGMETQEAEQFIGLSNRRYGIWNKAYSPYEESDPDWQGCKISFSTDDVLGEGRSARLDYDVESGETAYNGFFLRLNGENFSAYDTLNLYLRGDGENGFPLRIKMELKNSHKRYQAQSQTWIKGTSFPYVLSGITNGWKKFSIPLANFGPKHLPKDWSDMHELDLIFDDVNSRPKVGTVYIDQIFVSKEKPEGNQPAAEV